jgi:large-conductance mechanosensitive channel
VVQVVCCSGFTKVLSTLFLEVFRENFDDWCECGQLIITCVSSDNTLFPAFVTLEFGFFLKQILGIYIIALALFFLFFVRFWVDNTFYLIL